MNTADKSSCGGSFIPGACPGDDTIQVRPFVRICPFQIKYSPSISSAALRALTLHHHHPLAEVAAPALAPVNPSSTPPSRRKVSPMSGAEAAAQVPHPAASIAQA